MTRVLVGCCDGWPAVRRTLDQIDAVPKIDDLRCLPEIDCTRSTGT